MGVDSGTALDRLFDAERGALLTEVVVGAVQQFDLSLDELHNDSTTVRFCGQYRQARGRRLRGKRALFITYGYSKDHRSDLKQLLFILTTSEDGGVPVQFRCEHGNASDSRTHEQTWEALCRAARRVDFLYVAASCAPAASRGWTPSTRAAWSKRRSWVGNRARRSPSSLSFGHPWPSASSRAASNRVPRNRSAPPPGSLNSACPSAATGAKGTRP